jgi:hypothetical protein
MIDPKDLPHIDPAKLELTPAQQTARELQHARAQQELAKRYPTRQIPVGQPLPRKIQIVRS